MNRTLFSNRMGGRNLLYIASGFAIAGVILAFQDRDANVTRIVAIVGGLFVFAMLVLWLVMKFAMRNQLAELVRRDDTLEAELIHMFGRGEKLVLPIPAQHDWGWKTARAGRRGSRLSAILTLAVPGRTFTMPLEGAGVVDIEGLRAMAPDIVAELVRGGFVRA